MSFSASRASYDPYSEFEHRTDMHSSHSITNATRYWGQGVAGYANDLKDSVNASGPRVAVAGNPLGLAGQGSGKAQAPGAKGSGAAREKPKGSASNPLGI